MRISILAVFTLVFAMISTLVAASAEYSVSIKLSHEGEVFSSPSFMVEEGVGADMVVPDNSGNDYSLSVLVSEPNAGEYEVSAILDSEYGSMSPTVLTNGSEPASVAVNGLKMDISVQKQE